MRDENPSRTASWRRDGWVVMPGLIDADTLAVLRAGVDELASWATEGGPALHHFEQTDTGPVVARSEYFADEHHELGAFVRGELLAPILSDLLGEPAVLYKEKVNYKYPGGAGFAPHQDASAYRFVDHHISVMVPLDPATVETGCLDFASGHDEGLLPTDGRGRIATDVADSLD